MNAAKYSVSPEILLQLKPVAQCSAIVLLHPLKWPTYLRLQKRCGLGTEHLNSDKVLYTLLEHLATEGEHTPPPSPDTFGTPSLR
jgi:hypothetical protein